MPKHCATARWHRRQPPMVNIAIVATLALTVVTAACGGGSTAPKVTTQPPPPPIVTRQAKWGLEWADEFNGTAVDPANWVVVDGPARVNNELEYYTPTDAYIEAGSLVLRSQARTMGNRNYTSAEVRSGTKHGVGRGSAVEWRTQVPSGKGIWPANWLVSNSCDGLGGCGGNWPPEIDVMEMRGSLPTENIMTHWWGTWPAQAHESSVYTAATDLSAGYHTFRVEWFADSVMWYVDDVVRAKHIQNVTTGVMQLVMNTAVGGVFDGAPDPTTIFPKYQRIDYVRVYRDTANTY